MAVVKFNDGLASLIATLVLAGCVGLPVPVPTSEPNPFPNEVVSRAQTDIKTRNQMIALLGPPYAKNSSNTLHVWTDDRVVGALVWIGVGPSGGVEPITDGDRFVARYSRTGKVMEARPTRGVKGICDADGACLLAMNNLDVLAAPPAARAAALQTRSLPGKCAVYLMNRSPLPTLAIEHLPPTLNGVVKLDQRTVMHFVGQSRAFYYLTLRPGRHQIETSLSSNYARTHAFDCRAGEVRFLSPPPHPTVGQSLASDKLARAHAQAGLAAPVTEAPLLVPVDPANAKARLARYDMLVYRP